MIVSTAPLRVSFNGGGSDIESYFSRTPGSTVTATLDRSVYVMVHKSFRKEYRIAYSIVETVLNRSDIKHPLVRHCLEILDCSDYLEIVTVADVPSTGSGLGTSSAFTVALLNAIATYQGKHLPNRRLAELACEVEINLAHAPIGKQDQYASAFGGLKKFDFLPNGHVEVTNIFDSHEKLEEFFDCLNQKSQFFQVDRPRNTNSILEAQQKLVKESKNAKNSLDHLVDLAEQSVKSIISMNFSALGTQISTGWQIKMSLNGDNKSQEISKIHQVVSSSNALGAKLLGAGAGGFLFVLSNPEERLKITSLLEGLKEVDFKFKDQSPTCRSL